MQIWLTILSLVVYGCGSIIESSTVSFGVIRNTSLKIPHDKSTTINGTCEACLCALFTNPSLFSFNCFENNLTCAMHSKADQGKPFTLVAFATGSFYFVSLPTHDQRTSTVESTTKSYTIPTPLTSVEYLLTFDSTFQDLTATFNAMPENGADFSSTFITGYGSSPSLSSSNNHRLLIPTPQLKLDSQSWTFEAWIYLSR